jgi:hypothetical protein
VLGEDKRKSSPDDFEILSLTKLGRTRLEALRNLLAHLEDRTAEGIDRVEENTRKKEAAAAAKENRGKATEKKGLVKTGRVTEAASKTAMTKRTAIRSVLSRTSESKQARRSKGTRTENGAEDRDVTESTHSDEEAVEVAALGRGRNAVPKRTVPKQKKRKQTQVDDDDNDDEEEAEEEEDEDYDNHQPSKKLKSGNRGARQNLKVTGITHEDDAGIHAAEPRKPRYKPLNRQALLRKQKKEAREATQREKQDE